MAESLVDKMWNKLDSRLHISDLPLKGMPRYTLNISYWIGALVAAAFIYLGVTGVLLMMYYTPQPGLAYTSTQFIMTKVSYGYILLSSHQYAAYAMIFLVFVHFFRNYFMGLYKKPREGEWIVGIIMAILTILMGYTGYFLPYTIVSVEATDIGIGMAKSVPVIGALLVSMLRGNGTESAIFARFTTFHVLLIPIIIAVLLGLHFYIFEKEGASPPMKYENSEIARQHGKWFPTYFIYTLAVGALLFGMVFIISGLFPVRLLPEYGSGASLIPIPEWYLMPYYKVLDFVGISPQILVMMLLLLILFLILLPFLDRSKTRDPRERPFFVAIGFLNLSYLILLTTWAYLQPGIPIPDPEALTIMLGVLALDFGITYVLYFRYRSRKKLGRKGEAAVNE